MPPNGKVGNTLIQQKWGKKMIPKTTAVTELART